MSWALVHTEGFLPLMSVAHEQSRLLIEMQCGQAQATVRLHIGHAMHWAQS